MHLLWLTSSRYCTGNSQSISMHLSKSEKQPLSAIWASHRSLPCFGLAHRSKIFQKPTRWTYKFISHQHSFISVFCHSVYRITYMVYCLTTIGKLDNTEGINSSLQQVGKSIRSEAKYVRWIGRKSVGYETCGKRSFNTFVKSTPVNGSETWAVKAE